MRVLITLGLFFVGAVGLIGCESWSEGSEFRHAVFSDDGQGVAAVRLSFDQKDKPICSWSVPPSFNICAFGSGFIQNL